MHGRCHKQQQLHIRIRDRTAWDSIKSYAEEVIPVIREQKPDAVILVGTPTWSQEIDKAAASPLTFDNVMYTLHFYAGTHKDDLRNRLETEIRVLKIPLIVYCFKRF